MMTDPSQNSLLHQLPGMIYRRHPDISHQLLFVSEGCLALTGYTVAELTASAGIAYGDLIHPQDQTSVLQLVKGALRKRHPYHCFFRLITADNRERWVRDQGKGVFSNEGELIALAGFITDADDQDLQCQRLQQLATDQARKLSALHDILEAVGTPAELSVILTRALQAARSAVHGEAGYIHLREKSGKFIRLVVQDNLPDSVADAIGTLSIENGWEGWVTRNKESLLVSKTDGQSWPTHLADNRELAVYVGVPIMRGQRVWGTLSILGRRRSQFGDEEISLLTSVGEEIGIVVENARLRRQADRLLLIQERNRLARDLHDSVTQSLYSITLFAETGRRVVLAENKEDVSDYFVQIGETGQQALKEMRLLIHKLRPSILAREGLVRALQQRLNSVEGRAGMQHQLIVDREMKLSPALEEALFHIAQEALNNALKHALASQVIVRLKALPGDMVLLRVEDNGRGFILEEAAQCDGLGLATMRERAESFDGTVSIQSVPGEGSIVEAIMKLSTTPPRQGIDFNVEDLP